MSGASTEEDWEEVEDQGPLLGWGLYTRVYKVYIRQWTEQRLILYNIKPLWLRTLSVATFQGTSQGYYIGINTNGFQSALNIL